MMKKFNKNVVLGMGLIMLLTSLSACSNSSSSSQKSSASESVTQLDKVANSTYKKAVKNLEDGDVKLAYQNLKKVKIKKTTPNKVRQLKINVTSLYKAKVALENNNVTPAQKKLNTLASVSKPAALQKQIQVVKKEYKVVKLANIYYHETINYYHAEKYSDAKGSLDSLQALSSKYQAVAMLQKKTNKYTTLLNSKLKAESSSNATSATSSSSTSSANNSSYTNARNSKLVSSQYSKQTGSNISSATNSQVSAVASQLSDAEVISKFLAATGITQQEGDEYFTQYEGNNEYSIEIRNTSSNNSDISVMKGMYKFNTDTKVAQKQDAITGEYQQIN